MAPDIAKIDPDRHLSDLKDLLARSPCDTRSATGTPGSRSLRAHAPHVQSTLPVLALLLRSAASLQLFVESASLAAAQLRHLSFHSHHQHQLLHADRLYGENQTLTQQRL